MTDTIILLNRNSPLYNQYRGVVFEYNAKIKGVDSKSILKEVTTPIRIYMKDNEEISLVVNPEQVNIYSLRDLENTPYIINELIENISSLYDVVTILNDKVALLEAHLVSTETKVTRH